MIRNCVRCGAEISACMGFTLARDLLKPTMEHFPREHCGKCALWISLQADEGREYFLALPW